MEIFSTVEIPDANTLIPIFNHFASQKTLRGDEIIASLIEQVYTIKNY
jgi:hypothetical protein